MIASVTGWDDLQAALHRVMLRIVPAAYCPTERTVPLRWLIEISTAREIIWSQCPSQVEITAADEAGLLARLLAAGTTYGERGRYAAELHFTNVVAYNRDVMRHLRRIAPGARSLP